MAKPTKTATRIETGEKKVDVNKRGRAVKKDKKNATMGRFYSHASGAVRLGAKY